MLNKLKSGEVSQPIAALKLKISTRCVREKLKRVLADGDVGLVNKSRDRESHKKWCIEEKMNLIELLQNEWQSFGPKYEIEKL